MIGDPTTLLLLLAWGIGVGVDLVSFPQGLLSRPIVAAGVTGAILGDPQAGLRVGLVLELFALDVLPVGASRYPDFGPASVAAVVLAAGARWQDAVGPAVLLGLGLAVAGGRTMESLRRVNGRHTRRLAPRLAEGDPGAVARLVWAGLLGDAARSALLTGAGLAVALWLRQVLVLPHGLAPLLTTVVVAGGLVAAATGTFGRAGRRRGLLAAALGLAAGGMLAWLG